LHLLFERKRKAADRDGPLFLFSAVEKARAAYRDAPSTA
jgi:hypothetical protein